MYSGELEVQAKRKAIAVLQDEINRILNAGRVLSALPRMLLNKDTVGVKDALDQALRRKWKIFDVKLQGMYQMVVV